LHSITRGLRGFRQSLLDYVVILQYLRASRALINRRPALPVRQFGRAKLKIIFRNLSRETTEQQMHELFAAYGRLQSCDVVMDKASGQSKGFGFANMPIPAEAKAAIQGLNGKPVDGVRIRVKKADPDAAPKSGEPPEVSSDAVPAATASEPEGRGKRVKQDGVRLGAKKPRVFKKKS
jgi:RNA recognition motif-containing protein